APLRHRRAPAEAQPRHFGLAARRNSGHRPSTQARAAAAFRHGGEGEGCRSRRLAARSGRERGGGAGRVRFLPPQRMRRMDETESLSREAELREWRKAERKRLIDSRMTLRAEVRAALTERIAERLEALIGDPAGLVVSAYWPFRGEPDLKPLLALLREKGAITALPVVLQKAHPLEFRAWKSGDKLERGVWNIPI